VFGYGVGVFGFLTKRLIENGDLGAPVTAARWLVGPIVKAAGRKLSGLPAASWRVIVAESTGALLGPVLFGWETFRHSRGGVACEANANERPLWPASKVGRR
jgi:hypothetical protein